MTWFLCIRFQPHLQQKHIPSSQLGYRVPWMKRPVCLKIWSWQSSSLHPEYNHTGHKHIGNKFQLSVTLLVFTFPPKSAIGMLVTMSSISSNCEGEGIIFAWLLNKLLSLCFCKCQHYQKFICAFWREVRRSLDFGARIASLFHQTFVSSLQFCKAKHCLSVCFCKTHWKHWLLLMGLIVHHGGLFSWLFSRAVFTAEMFLIAIY